MTVLSPSQEAIMHFLRIYIRDIGYPPTLREIADGVHLRSASAVHHNLKILEDFGLIRRDFSRPRGLVIMDPPDKQ